MEISTLQKMWRQLERSSEQKEPVMAASDISAGIEVKSDLIYAKIDRAMKGKILMSSFFLVVTSLAAANLLWTGVNDSFLRDILTASQLGALLVGISGIMMTVAIINWYGRQLIVRFRSTSGSLKTSIQESISVLQRIQKTEIWSDTIGVPVIACMAISGWLYNNSDWQWDYRILVVFSITALVGIWGFYTARKVNQRYQPYIDGLLAHASELTE